MPARRNDDESNVNEETSLLTNTKRPPCTPLPWLQLSIISLVQLCEPMTSQSIYPYINQLVSELDITGGDERKVGYYAGLIESLFFATQAITILQWSRISDYVGRKPVLLTGLMGLSISVLSFGLSRTFWGLVVSRCICGMLNGNMGVIKSVMGELTDSTNRADGFSLMPVIWGVGIMLGSLMGGNLSKPHDRFPNVFGGAFWEKYPYLLPCVAVASFALVSATLVFVFFKETVQVKAPTQPTRKAERTLSIHDEALPAFHRQLPRDGPVPLRDLLVFPVVISISNYAVLAFLNIGFASLQPLFFAMPVEIGGLGLSPPAIGAIIGAYGVTTGTLQVFFFARIVRRFGMKQVVFAGMFVLIPIFCLFPIMSVVARGLGMSPLIWVLVGIQVALSGIMDMAYGCTFMYITSAAPNKRSLGSTNGLAQMSVAIGRALGPALSTSLFSFSVEHNVLGGYGVYAILALASALALLLVVPLPQGEWEHETE